MKQSSTVLTLRIDSDLRDKIKERAEQENRSMSNMVELYLRDIFNEDEIEEIEVTPEMKASLDRSRKSIKEGVLYDLDLNNLDKLFDD